MNRLLLPAIYPLVTTIITLGALCCSNMCAQEIVFADDTKAQRWIASASLGITSPFGPNEYSAEWNGSYSMMASIEYIPDVRASFGMYASHTRFEHSGRTVTGTADCMRGIVRKQTGAGLVAHVYAVRWNGFRLMFGGNVGATNVARERPLLDVRGDAYGKVDLPSSLDLEFGTSIGLEATIAPEMSVAIEVGYEAVENQADLNGSLLARTSVRLGI